MAARKKPAKKKASTKKPRVSWRSSKERGAALALLDFNGGNIAKTARMLGLSRQTLQDWKDGRGIDGEAVDERIARREDIGDAVDGLILEYIEAAKSKLNTKDATFYRVNGALNLILNQRMTMLGRPTQITASLTGPSAPAAGPEQTRTAYERIIDDVIQDEAAAGRTVTRDQAAKMIIEVQPEAANFLKVSGEQPS